ncbi:MAG: hypothetical protein EU544_04010 [Promethearchaeota archaeon]|nr:MAG: hypothetical protein EU544_04010 [Candidatus Lokiarchaeota archaeon]
MSEFFKKLNQYLTLKNVSGASLILNLACIIFGILYIAIPVYLFLWEIFGAILLITLFGNFLLVFLSSSRVNKATKLGNKLRILNYSYLIFLILAMVPLILLNFLISVTYSNALIDNIWGYLGVYSLYFGIFVFGLLIAYFIFQKREDRELWGTEGTESLSLSDRTLTMRKILKIILGILSLLFLGVGIFFSFAMLAGIWALGIILPHFAFAYALMFLSATIILLKLLKPRQNTKLYYAITLIGLIVTAIHLTPLALTPYSVYSGDQNFSLAFGNDWHSKIDPDIEQEYFLQSAFWIPGYFLGIPPKDCNYKADVLYFDGSESNYSQDEDIKLYYDVFWPKEDKNDMPGIVDGKHAVIIKIHGGSWRYGDKGIGHMMQVNKYFASQGYAVFDIQYGLKDTGEAASDPLAAITPDNVKGDFDIDDMVRHIGNFTKYLPSVEDKYDLNLDYVFVNGGSAGGHLTCTTGLGIASGDYISYFGDNLTIKGIIPIYPANGYSGLDGKKAFKNPEKYLIEKDTPPMLIYQGTHDFVCAEVSRNIKEAYAEEDNDECCIIWLPLAGHANDLYFSGYYSLPFLYYWERFMYLTIEGEIE